MRIAIYPGSFNPWHEGHSDVLQKALQTFDKVIVARGFNPEKDTVKKDVAFMPVFERIPHPAISVPGNWEFVEFSGLLRDFAKEVGACAVIKGLRNAKDFQYELEQQYWNEDLGLTIPTMYVISDRKLVHLSSTAIRMLQRMKVEIKREDPSNSIQENLNRSNPDLANRG